MSGLNDDDSVSIFGPLPLLMRVMVHSLSALPSKFVAVIVQVNVYALRGTPPILPVVFSYWLSPVNFRPLDAKSTSLA